MGTPDFAAVSLRALVEGGFDVCAVVTQPDKVNARGNKIIPCAVKAYAESVGLPVYQPTSLKNGEGDEIFDRYDPDIAVVAAYGKILPQSLLKKPKYGCINVHASLLPAYRGASPIQTAIINGETESGVTIMQLDVGMDTGDMLASAKVDISSEQTAGELFDCLAKLGAGLLTEVIPEIEKGKIVPEKQDEEKATYAPMISKEAAVIDYCMPAQNIVNLVRGLNPNPIAKADVNGKRLKVFCAKVGDKVEGNIGDVYEKDGKIAVVCGDGKELLLCEVQCEGGKRMECAAYLRGHPLTRKE